MTTVRHSFQFHVQKTSFGLWKNNDLEMKGLTFDEQEIMSGERMCCVHEMFDPVVMFGLVVRHYEYGRGFLLGVRLRNQSFDQ